MGLEAGISRLEEWLPAGSCVIQAGPFLCLYFALFPSHGSGVNTDFSWAYTVKENGDVSGEIRVLGERYHNTYAHTHRHTSVLFVHCQSNKEGKC